MARYRRRALVVEAEQFLPPDQVPNGVHMEIGPGGKVAASVVTMHGEVSVKPGDWILPEPTDGQFYPVDGETFERTYEPVRDVIAGVVEISKERLLGVSDKEREALLKFLLADLRDQLVHEISLLAEASNA